MMIFVVFAGPTVLTLLRGSSPIGDMTNLAGLQPLDQTCPWYTYEFV